MSRKVETFGKEAMTPNVLLVQLVNGLGACKEPDEACRMLADAHEWLGSPSMTAATRQLFWEALYLDLVSLTYDRMTSIWS
jgi:hypothetical protein